MNKKLGAMTEPPAGCLVPFCSSSVLINRVTLFSVEKKLPHGRRVINIKHRSHNTEDSVTGAGDGIGLACRPLQRIRHNSPVSKNF